MKTILIALKLLWKRKVQNTAMLLQVLLSVIMLAQSFVFIMNHFDNVRALTELPKEQAAILSVWDDAALTDIQVKIEKCPMVEGVGSVYASNIQLGESDYNALLYSPMIIEKYQPTLKEGVWLSQEQSKKHQPIDAIISAELGLDLGDERIVIIGKNKHTVRICGILAEPTQYFHPTGSASPEYFSAEAVIANEPVMILPHAALVDNSDEDMNKYLQTAQNLMIFFKQDAQEADKQAAIRYWNRFGEITPMQRLISNYTDKTNKIISGGLITFGVFLSLALASVLSNQVIQAMHNRYLFTIYHMVGMSWRQIALTEMIRLFILVMAMMILVSLSGRAGLLMLEWMTPRRVALFYGITFLYNVLMLVCVGMIFLRKLIKEDISLALKNLQQG